METILTANQMRMLDEATVKEYGVPACILMERAALSVRDCIYRENYPSDHVIVLCKEGNNGGDGFCVARLFAEEGKDVSVYFDGDPSKMSQACRLNYESCIAYGIPIENTPDLSGKKLLIDALLGIGLNRPLNDKTRQICEKVNEYRSCHDEARVVSIDIASGIFTDTGGYTDTAIKADMTVTFAHKKPGHLLYPGSLFTGTLKCTDIGITDRGLSENEKYIEVITKEDLPLIKRRPDSNKGTYGKALIIAGSEEVCGCSILAALSCFKAGAGMVRVLTHASNKDLIINALPEAMVTVYEDELPENDILKGLYDWADVIGIGPGIGKNGLSKALLDSALFDNDLPLVIDADAIDLLKEHCDEGMSFKKDIIITPHVGEMSRFTDIQTDLIKKDPIGICRDTAEKYGLTVCLKDARTVTSDKNGRIRINMSGNDGMSVAGMGDVLLGLITSLAAQGADCYDAASFGAFIHGLCGDRYVKECGSKSTLLPSDLIEYIKYYVE
ncbi:MAG: NAD(P)H-hydrate dehydratase [Lachnospiraceae bacterium]|nr:NAD(P)H-hydrate dehydratase [Lachnospiraceae bacterium]